MGYDLHITRAEEWTESEQTPITLDEWLACVAADPELRLQDVARTTTPDGDDVALQLPGLAVWTAWPQHDERGAMAYLWHFEGGIDSRALDEPFRCKLFQIAQRLGGRVLGDEGEEYGARGEVLEQPDDDFDAPPRRPSWFALLFGRRHD